MLSRKYKTRDSAWFLVPLRTHTLFLPPVHFLVLPSEHSLQSVPFQQNQNQNQGKGSWDVPTQFLLAAAPAGSVSFPPTHCTLREWKQKQIIFILGHYLREQLYHWDPLYLGNRSFNTTSSFTEFLTHGEVSLTIKREALSGTIISGSQIETQMPILQIKLFSIFPQNEKCSFL